MDRLSEIPCEVEKTVMSSEDLVRRLESLERRVEKLEAHFGSEIAVSVPKERKMSAKEFLLTKNLKVETQKVLALAYFLEREEGLASFNVQELEVVFRAAREKLPKNMNDAVNKNIARGFLMETKEKKDSKKAWQLTSTGERFVENEMR
jgi:hypothetical protein